MVKEKEKASGLEEIVFDIEKMEELENIEEVITPGAGTVFCCTN